jgi:hypothetical protein
MSDRDRGYRSKSEPATRARGQVVRRPEDPDDALARPPAARRTPETPAPHPDEGTFSGLVAPHPGSTPLERGAQIVLTCVALPLVVITFVTFGWFDLRGAVRDFQENAPVRRAGGIAHPITWIVGAVVLIIALAPTRLGPGPTITLVLVQLGALFLRRWLRNGIDARAPHG